jgi:hypothetical protein
MYIYMDKLMLLWSHNLVNPYGLGSLLMLQISELPTSTIYAQELC